MLPDGTEMKSVLLNSFQQLPEWSGLMKNLKKQEPEYLHLKKCLITVMVSEEKMIASLLSFMKDKFTFGDFKGSIVDKKVFEKNLTDYYKLRKWDIETSRPDNEVLKELDLGFTIS
ncbi:MAG: hypothetical protein MZV49_11420 [Rhodopseudomonas palustris]|nr:hypothetical protein [Rhodopseudomonas palustris]